MTSSPPPPQQTGGDDTCTWFRSFLLITLKCSIKNASGVYKNKGSSVEVFATINVCVDTYCLVASVLRPIQLFKILKNVNH